MSMTIQHAATVMSLQSSVNATGIAIIAVIEAIRTHIETLFFFCLVDVLYVAGITSAQHAFTSKYIWNTALNLNRSVTSSMYACEHRKVDKQLKDIDIQIGFLLKNEYLCDC